MRNEDERAALDPPAFELGQEVHPNHVEIAEAGHALPIQCAPHVNAILAEHFAGTPNR